MRDELGHLSDEVLARSVFGEEGSVSWLATTGWGGL